MRPPGTPVRCRRRSPLTGIAAPDRERLVALLGASLTRSRRPDGRRLTQKAVAEELAVVQQTTSRWFRGETTPAPLDLERLRRLLGWTDDEYVGLFLDPLAATADELGRLQVALGLPPHFPTLFPLRPRPPREGRDAAASWPSGPTADLAPIWSERRRAALERLRQSDIGIRVEGPAGQGLSTVANDLLAFLTESSVVRRLVVAHVSLERLLGVSPAALIDAARELVRRLHPLAAAGRGNPDEDWVRQEGEALASHWLGDLADPDRVHRLVQDAIAEQVFLSMVTSPWERAIGRRRYAELIGARTPDPEHLAERRAELAALGESAPFDDAAWVRIERGAPRLARRWQPELLRDLWVSDRVRTCVVWDLSPTPVGRFPLAPGQGEILTTAYQGVLTAVQASRQTLGASDTDHLTDHVVFAPTGVILEAFERSVDEKVELDPLGGAEIEAILDAHLRTHVDPNLTVREFLGYPRSALDPTQGLSSIATRVAMGLERPSLVPLDDDTLPPRLVATKSLEGALDEQLLRTARDCVRVLEGRRAGEPPPPRLDIAESLEEATDPALLRLAGDTIDQVMTRDSRARRERGSR